MSKIRILYVNGGVMDHGGISTHIMNYLRNIDHEKFEIDVVAQGEGENEYIEEIEQYNGELYSIPGKTRNLLKNISGLYRIINQGNYDIVHAHADSGNGVILLISFLCGVKTRISHSHSISIYSNSVFHKIFSYLQRILIRVFATSFWGCSEQACKWLYGDKPYKVIYNALETNKYEFNGLKRDKFRKDFEIGDKLAICQIGHISDIKNQIYSIKVLNGLIQNNIECELFIIGNGDNKDIIKEASDFNIRKKVKFLGGLNNISDILNAMDIMLQPSLVEGLGITVIEAQVNGLPAITSKSIPSEAILIDSLVTRIGIDNSDIQLWVQAIKTASRISGLKGSNPLFEKYDIKKAVKILECEYVRLVNECN